MRQSHRVIPALPALLGMFVAAGCASPEPASSDLMTLPQNEVFEVNYTASVPAAVAYKNLLAKANQC